MRRREFVLLGGATLVLWSAAANTQTDLPVVGYINAAASADSAELVGAFKQGLSEAGFVEGRSVLIEYRWADDNYDRLPAMVADAISHHVAVIAATSTPVALAAKTATRTIPIVFTIGGDPVKLGLVSALNRPMDNLTGFTRYNVDLGPKRLELLHDLVPGASRVGLVVNPNNPNTETVLNAVRKAAHTLGIEIQIARASSDSELNDALATLSWLPVAAVVIGNDPFFNSRSQQLAALTLRHSVPAIYQYRKFVEAGGLMSYGASNSDSHRQLGVYVGRILAGAKPTD